MAAATSPGFRSVVDRTSTKSARLAYATNLACYGLESGWSQLDTTPCHPRPA
jgi:hypothetical protein